MSNFFKFLFEVVRALGAFVISFRMGKAAGKKEEQIEQMDRDLDALARAEAARRAVKHDPDSVRNDPFNRDK
jgi:hypothetical protein